LDFQLESLKAFGVSESELEFQPPKTDTVVERLWFATPLGHCHFSARTALLKISDRLKFHFQIAPEEPSRRLLYISRAKASRRRITRESEVLSVLQNRHFECVYCEDLSLRDQVRLFAEAKVIIGPHGAGFTNILYAREGTIVGEIYGVDCIPCYKVMAHQLSLSYHKYQAQPASTDAAHPDLAVDSLSFALWLDSLVET
jgi:capsular polysaccharide biosynthesis protein